MFANKIKLQRAIASLPKGASEEEIKNAYVKMGGHLLEETKVVQPLSPVKEEKETIVKKIVKNVTKKVIKKKK